MSSSTFKILKQCENCGNLFEAQKRTTRFCSHGCNSQHYKLRKKIELKREIEQKTFHSIKAKPKVKAIDVELIKCKPFLSVLEVSCLLGCSKQTVYRMIQAKELNGQNLFNKLTRIKNSDIESLFSYSENSQLKELTIADCYQMEEIKDKYNIAANTIYNYVRKHNIQRLKQNGITFYSKVDIDNLFQVF